MTVTRLHAARLIDGTGAAPLDEAVLTFEDDRIIDVGQHVSARSDGPERSVQDFPGCTIMPGLIDAHVHLTMSAGPDPWVDQERENDAQLVMRAVVNAGKLVEAGVTTVRDLGARNNTIFDVRAGAEMGIVPAPRLLVAGRPITPTGGHCCQFNGEADGEEQLRAAVRRLFKQGADFVKVMATGGFRNRGSGPYVPAYTDAELSAVVDEVHRTGNLLTVHVTGNLGVWQAVRCGVDMIEHLPMMTGPGRWEYDERLADEIRERGIYVSATIAGGYRASELRAAGRTIPTTAARLPLETRLKNLQRLYESGVALVVGTDSGARMTAFGDATALEIEALVKVGMPPLQAIRAGTSLGATAIGLGAETGALEAGKWADILVVEGDPSQDISAIRNVVAVFKAGKQVYARPSARG